MSLNSSTFVVPVMSSADLPALHMVSGVSHTAPCGQDCTPGGLENRDLSGLLIRKTLSGKNLAT